MSADEPIRPDLPDDGSGDEHLEWRLSALLDGELSVTEEMVAREHLAGCDLCQDEFAEVMAARALVRGLGEVDLPKGTIERTMGRIQRRYQVRLGLFGLLALAVAWIVLLFLLAGLSPPKVDAPVDSFVNRHRDALLAPEETSGMFDSRSLSDELADELPAPFVLPDELGDGLLRVHAAEYSDGVVHGVYRDDDGTTVSLFEQEGRLDWEALPDIGEQREIGGRTVWVDERPAFDVVVVPMEDSVLTLVGDAPLEGLVSTLPESADYTGGDRLRLSVEGMLRRLGID